MGWWLSMGPAAVTSWDATVLSAVQRTRQLCVVCVGTVPVSRGTLLVGMGRDGCCVRGVVGRCGRIR